MSRLTLLRTLLIASAGAASLAGCIVGPSYRTPDRVSTAPVTFNETGELQGAGGAGVSLAAPLGDWWRLYDQPAVDALVRKALTHNTDLRQAEANIAQYRAILAQQNANSLPATALSAGGSYGRSSNGGGLSVPSFPSVAAGTTSGGSGSGGSNATTTGSTTSGSAGGAAGSTTSTANTGSTGAASGTTGVGSTGRANWTYNAAFDAAYEVDLFGRIRRGVQAARADLESVIAARDLVRVNVAAETARAFANACAYEEAADVARRSLKAVSDSYDVTVKQRDLGSASDFEVANARALVEQTRAPIPQLEASRRSSLYGLAVLTGDPPEVIDAAAQGCRTPPKLARPIPVGDGRELIRRRPDVREAERKLAAASARIGVATADLFPTISLGGVISTAGHNGGDLTSRAGVSYGLGPLITWNFPNVVTARARIAQAQANTQMMFAAFDGAVLTALQDAEQSLATYGGELRRNAALRAARDQSAEAYRLGRIRLEAGSISFVDLITIQRTFIDAESTLASSDAALVSDQVSVFKALGGGWENAPAMPTTPLPGKAGTG